MVVSVRRVRWASGAGSLQQECERIDGSQCDPSRLFDRNNVGVAIEQPRKAVDSLDSIECCLVQPSRRDDEAEDIFQMLFSALVKRLGV